MNIVVTLTTIPNRLSFEGEMGLKKCIDSLINQDTDKEYEIHFNIPSTNKKSGQEYIVPEWLSTLAEQESKLKLFTGLEDQGTITKLYYTIQRVTDPEAIIIVCDDDLIYHPKMIDEQVNNQLIYEDTSVGYDGTRAEFPTYNDVRDHYVVSVDRNVEVNYLQHYKTVSYKRKWFDEDFYTDFIDKSWNDDIILGAYMTKRGIKKMVTFYKDEEPITTLEDWQQRGGVTTFPCLGHTHHESLEGCNLYRNEQINDNGGYFLQLGLLK